MSRVEKNLKNFKSFWWSIFVFYFFLFALIGVEESLKHDILRLSS